MEKHFIVGSKVQVKAKFNFLCLFNENLEKSDKTLLCFRKIDIPVEKTKTRPQETAGIKSKNSVEAWFL